MCGCFPKGRELAEKIIRRHRLAERLASGHALGAPVDESEVAACEYEHLLAEGITNSICTPPVTPQTAHTTSYFGRKLPPVRTGAR